MPTRLQQPAHEGQIIRNMFLPEVPGAVGLKFAEVGRALRARLDLVVEVLSPWHTPPAKHP